VRLAFLGTPDFACPSLAALVAAGHDVALVVSQPDKVRGRGRKPSPTPVRALADRLNLGHTVLERGRVAREALYEHVLDLAPEVVVVVAFGHILREPLLHGAPFGCVNVHASLLPRWRGPAPIHRAIVAGDTLTGVCTMELEAGVDTGGIYLQRETPIGPEETAGDVHDRLARLGAEVLVETLEDLPRGLRPRPQGEEGMTHAPLLRREEGSVAFDQAARTCHDRVRGLSPWPAVTVLHGDRRLKLLRTRSADARPDASPGTVIAVGRESFSVACGVGALEVLEVQPQAKRAMGAADYARGYRLQAGDVLRTLPDFAP
jgi:methionyl-tRNA formyltransferase